jgi:peptidoglycan/xylan/chitin deacetylase (PgdA/CDA1 family)
MLTIVTYHYVRNLPKTRYPKIKGLLTEKFEGQLDYITKHYTVCSLQQVIAAARGEDLLPPNPCLLTFDDGFLDHYLTVFPCLQERRIVGSFYPPARAIEEHKVLDVHKIHFILASTTDYGRLVEEIFQLLQPHRGDYEVPEDGKLYAAYARQGRYDPPEIVFIKRILQRGLPERVRADVMETLFTRYVSMDEEAFAHELYMDMTQLRCMQSNGMEIGGHGYEHTWLETLECGAQQEEIQYTVDFLEKIYGYKPSDWTMCYPYGSYNTTTIQLLENFGCALGLTIKFGLADLLNPYEMKRVDTNDLPLSGDAEISDLTREALNHQSQ